MIPALIATTVVFLLSLVVVLTLGYREANSLVVRRVEFDFADLPPAFEGYRIVFASDFHVLRMKSFQRKVLDALGGLRGDLLVLGGDFQDHGRKPADGGKAFADALGEFAGHFADGIVAVRGNHDNGTMRAHLRNHHAIRYLSGGAMAIERAGQKIGVAGAKQSPRGRERMKQRMARLAGLLPEEAKFRILVAHWPEYFPAAKGEGFDLVLCGDTHGGQIRLPLIGAVVRKSKMPRRCCYGPLREDGTVLYTTGGVGTRGLPLRLGCPPEIIVLELHRRKSP